MDGKVVPAVDTRETVIQEVWNGRGRWEHGLRGGARGGEPYCFVV